MTVNLSALQFRSGTLFEDLQAALDATKIEVSRVCLELTEHLLIEDQDNVAEQLAELKGLGVKIAIDDFGTGYSSLSYLWRFEPNVLKIDKSFFEAYSFAPARYAKLIETMISLGHQLDMVVMMEGVEIRSQLDFWASTECDFFQGYYLGRPMPLAAATALADGGTSSGTDHAPKSRAKPAT